MMYVKYVFITIILLGLSGCSIKENEIAKFAIEHEPISSHIEYEILGEVTSTASTARVLFFTTYTDGDQTDYESHFNGDIATSKAKKRAIFEAIDSIKGAHALISPRWKIEETNFLGIASSTTVVLHATAIKYVTKKK